MTTLRYILAAALLAAWAPAVSALDVGIAARSILPDPLLPVSGGMGLPQPVTKAEGQIGVRALVLRSDDATVAIVSVDSIGFPSVLADRIREQVKDIPAENIIVGATHTHSAPDTYAFPLPLGGHTGDLDYMNWVCLQGAAAVNEALASAKPASLKIATGEAKGKIAYNYYAPQLYDPRCSVIQAIGEDGKAIATLVNYAVHPEVLGPDVGIVSPDLVGPLYDRIAEAGGGTGIFMNGAQGGMVTADNRDYDKPKPGGSGVWEDSRTWEECIRIGNTLADEALRIVSEAPVQASPKLYCAHRDVTFPVDNEILWQVVVGSPLDYPRNDADHTIQTDVNLVNIGNAQILTIPGEALPNIGYYLKRKMHGENNLLFGLTNDAFGYILTKEDFDSFKRYDYVSETSLGERTGEILVDSLLAFADESPRPETIK
ncbi:MAG: hypothetical protein GC168_05320 [Candidatus Hydrogenedens sp.]|nr:hypothetical protein [Candidatus Hydrogenedens sp.]